MIEMSIKAASKPTKYNIFVMPNTKDSDTYSL